MYIGSLSYLNEYELGVTSQPCVLCVLANSS